MALKDEIEAALRNANLDDPVVELETTAAGKVGGFVVSRTFVGMPQLDRQNHVWSFLDTLLSKDKRARIVALLTLTPEEADEPAVGAG